MVQGLSNWDFHLPRPTMHELALAEQFFVAGLIEGVAHIGPRWPVLLLRWTKELGTSQ